MSWHGRLDLTYRLDGHQTTAHDKHTGPLRVLQRLYPEGERICHHVLVHPPGGIVGGDVLELHAQLAEGTHALVTTPGATRFYRSAGALAEQCLNARVENGARLEWLPLETIAYKGCRAENRMRFDLAPEAQMIGWDILALGLPAANEPFDAAEAQHGTFTQEIDLPGVWLERGTVTAADQLLLDSPVGWAGNRVMATMWFAAGQAIPAALRDQLLDAAREAQVLSPLAATSGSTSPQDAVVVLRVLAPRVEPIMALLSAVWGRWRTLAWGVPPSQPRVWRT